MRRRPGGFILAALVGAPSSAMAQDVSVPESVRSRSAPNSERRGIRTGPVVTYLGVGVRGTYNDNIFAEQDDPVADYVARVRPRVHVRTRTERHGARATAEAEASRHVNNPSEDVLDYGGRLEGHLDLGARTRVGAEIAAIREHEDRTSPDDPEGAERTPIDRYALNLNAQTRLGRLTLTAAGGLERLNFTDVTAADGDGEINNDDRDRRTLRLTGRFSYGLSAKYEPFLQAAYSTITYDQDRDDDGFDRDSNGFEVGAGLRYRPSEVTVAEARAGYRKQRLDDRRLGGVEGLTAELALRSNLTRQTTLELAGHRLVQQSTISNASAFFSTRLRGRLDHRVRPNLLVGADGSVARHSFQGIGRQDRIFGAGVDARYDPSAHLRLTMDYRFARRVSTTDAGFQRNTVTLGAEVRY